jgi:hypothetical protein
MKISLDQVWKNIKSRFSGNERIWHRDRDWKLIILFGVVGTLGVLAFDGYLFFQIKVGLAEPVVATVTDSVAALDTVKLDAVLGSFESKAQRFEAYKQEKPKVADPSL